MPVFIGLDVGGTKIAAGLVSLPSGKVWQRQVMPTLPARGAQAVLTDALSLAASLAEAARNLGHEVVGIGVGVPELVDLAGNVVTGDTIAWAALPARAQFEQIAPAIIESDVRAAAQAEALLGAGHNCPNFAYVTVGTGISYSLVLDGRPYTGARGNALVLGSMPVPCRCAQCGADEALTLEQVAAGPALTAGYQELTGQPIAWAEDVLERAAAGDAAASEVARRAGRALGGHVAWLVNVLDPERLVIGGGLGLAEGRYWESFLVSLREHIYAPNAQQLPVLRAGLGRDAGWVGAAASAWMASRTARDSGAAVANDGRLAGRPDNEQVGQRNEQTAAP